MPLPSELGRLRVNQRELALILRLMGERRLVVLAQRFAAKNDGLPLHKYQWELHHIRNLYQECMLLAEQKGWDVESEPEHEERTDPPTADRQRQRVG